MHIHQSLFQGEHNAFFDEDDEHYLSEVGRKFIAGLLRHAAEITLVTNQWVNSYKRLVPGYEAPVYVSWSHVNRADLVRVPAYKPGYESSMRIEYRAPDPACNPYLAFSAMLAAGMKGIEEDYPAPPPMAANAAGMSEEQRQALGNKVSAQQPGACNILGRRQRTAAGCPRASHIPQLHPEQAHGVGGILFTGH